MSCLVSHIAQHRCSLLDDMNFISSLQLQYINMNMITSSFTGIKCISEGVLFPVVSIGLFGKIWPGRGENAKHILIHLVREWLPLFGHSKKEQLSEALSPGRVGLEEVAEEGEDGGR